MSDIILTIQPSELKQTKDCVTSHELWQKLELVYQSRGPARKATLLKQIVLQRIGENDDVRNHLRKFVDAVDKLSEMNVAINDDLLSIVFLYGLPVGFENFRCAIESRDELPKPSILRIKIVEESDARHNERRDATQNVMTAERKYDRKSANKSEKIEKERAIKCYRCKKTGHKATDCKAHRKYKKYNANRAEENASLYITSETSSCKLVRAAGSDNDRTWCLDSGCTSHMCKNLDNFSYVESNSSDALKLANNYTTAIRARGVVPFVTNTDGRNNAFNLRDTLCVPDLRTNLLSVAKIVDKGHRVVFDKNSARITDKNNDTLFVADRINGLYYVSEPYREEQGKIARTESKCKRSFMD